MEIFSEEFKAELSNQLEALTKVVEYKPTPITDYEIAKSMDDCLGCEEIAKKSKKKKEKKFKLGDFVYLELLSGEIVMLDKKRDLIVVEFINGVDKDFCIDGSICKDSPKLLSHYPYELKKKKSKH
jgi:hypothetical protein